jgi:uncharacterized protein (UPF0335 family)
MDEESKIIIESLRQELVAKVERLEHELADMTAIIKVTKGRIA